MGLSNSVENNTKLLKPMKDIKSTNGKNLVTAKSGAILFELFWALFLQSFLVSVFDVTLFCHAGASFPNKTCTNNQVDI